MPVVDEPRFLEPVRDLEESFIEPVEPLLFGGPKDQPSARGDAVTLRRVGGQAKKLGGIAQ